ncbi:acyl-CoA dehydrogenase family protein [Eubacterium barkeri]|uniref:Butyryl-CoA dehydrogenase n=1 Tax=Eubacterium barkeri TaxID=1528 RepID=A0A1H3I4B5_EUBBA|nr:acyl-CoA dehydrogenase family protein [Eubacterium barkeri]SDY22501.1 butyryl-CoA dehydrogenase [Eubacterium barkeri]
MKIRMNDEERAIVEACDTFGKQVLAPLVEDMEAGKSARDAVRKMGEMGLLGMVAPEEYGGMNATWRMLILAMETLGKYNEALAEHINISNCNFIMPLLRYANDEQKAEWIPKIITGDMLCAFNLTEPNAGSDNGMMATTAVLDGDDYVLNGSKCFITDAEEADALLTFAVTSPSGAEQKEISCFMVEKSVSNEGMTISNAESTLGMHGAPVFSVFFDNCRVPKKNLVGKLGDGFKAAMWGLNPGRVCLSALAVSIAQHAIDVTIDYVKSRKMFGKTLADFQNTQFVLAECQAKLDAANLLVLEAAASLDTGTQDFQLCSETKMFAPEVSNEVVYKCMQLLGGYSYTTDYPLERLYRNVRITTIFEGATEVHKHTVARLMGIRSESITNIK